MNSILLAFIASMTINLAMFIPAFVYKTDKITDISYAATFAFVVLAGFAASKQTPLHALVTFLVLVWSMRLGTFLFIRILRMGKDKRFDGMREKFFSFIRFWLLQGLTVFVVMLSVILAFKQDDARITILSLVGVVIFILGLAIEATADFQKFAFTGIASNKDKWIDSGIWRTTRHPNYLGEMLVWIGMYIVVLPSLQGTSVMLALLSPLFIMTLLLFVSGIPLLEKAADKKWGTNREYLQYKKQVPVLLPTFSSVRRALK